MVTDNSSTKRCYVSMTYTHTRAADGSDVCKAVGGVLSPVPERVNFNSLSPESPTYNCDILLILGDANEAKDS